ncbi:MAG: DMT family transporter [Thermoanaerobacterales bacterium]|nr:DMT family transporter [Bacillota bacterium]MDI6908003.1 DMT family transporter [Thermoanaerobacterales bacterium]
MNRHYQALADLALLLVTFIWGITFVIVKEALGGIGPYYFLAIRFILAALFLVLIRYRALRYLRRDTLWAGTVIGVALFGGYAFQTVGLQYTTASNAGFITGLSVVLVPLMAAVLTRHLPPPAAVAGVICATAGLALLSLQDGLHLSYGDALILCCALCYAVHIILVGRYAPYHRTYALAVIQIAAVGLISLAVAPFAETFPHRLSPAVIEALLATAIPATALAFVIQNAAQKFTSTTHTAVIFTMEPVFAGLTAWLLGGETLGARQWIGGAAIILGMLVTVLGTPSGTGQEGKKSPAGQEPFHTATAGGEP